MLSREMDNLNAIQIELLRRKTAMDEMKHTLDMSNGLLDMVE